MSDWNYDMKKAPRTGICLFGCNTGGSVVVMHWRGGGFVIPAGHQKWDAFDPVGWMEIPPVNIAGE